MIKVQPQGQIYLCKTPLENDYKNQLTFSTKANQTAYFTSTVVKSYDNNTYIHKDGGVKINCNAEEIRSCNYMFYKNTGFDNRIYYCFITNIEYISENSTLVRFETDCFQTWYFDLVYKPCFVEREHVSDDTVGAHTVPEGLETGEYVENNVQNIAPQASDISWGSGYTYEGGNLMIAFQVSELLPSFYSVANVAQNYNGIYSGLFILGVDSASDALEFIRGYDAEGKSSAIVSCFITYPHFFNAGYTQAVGTHGHSVTLYPAKTGDTAKLLKSNITLTTGMNFSTLNGYTPKNNKLKTYPYCYYLADNNAGQAVVYRNEFFMRNTAYPNPTFSIYGAIGQGNSIKLVPESYKGNSSANGNYQEGLQAGKLPVCAWASDYYLNWVTQNAINMNTSVITSTASGAISGGLYGGVAGAVVGGVTSGIMGVIGNIAKTETAKIMPDTARGNTNVSDLNIGYFGSNLAGSLFTIKPMSIRAEYARIIDDFFTMYGYKVNIVKTPSITGRQYWNFVKTVDCNIEGDIPQEDLQVVRTMFNKGCTFWHGASNMYNYNLTNSIV